MVQALQTNYSVRQICETLGINRSNLYYEPIEEALCQSVPEIHHSDQGVQYLSNAYVSMLKHHRIEISVARRGCPWKNGYAERLIRTLKEEEVYLNDYKDIHEARARIGHFIDQCITRNVHTLR